MTQLKPGDAAPNFILQTVEGVPFSLNEILRSGQNVLLVFLRHLG
jgi:peroxiredoxin